MKSDAFCSLRFHTSSPNGYELGKYLCCSYSSLPCLSLFRCFVTKNDAAIFNSREIMKNINGLDDALCLYESMSKRRPLPNIVQFNQLLSRVISLKGYSAAINLFKDIRNLRISVDNCTMNIAVNSFCLAGRVDYGLSILGCFFKHGHTTNLYTFHALLRGMFQEKRINDARELCRKMVREGNCELDIVTYGIVIDGLGKAGHTSMAVELLRAMENGILKPNTQIYNSVINNLCKDGKIDSALALFNEMPQKGVTLTVVTYTALIRGLCSFSRWEEVKRLMKEMVDFKISPDVFTFTILIDALCKEGMVDEAKDVLGIMKQQNVVPDVVSYSALMDGYCLQGRLEEARDIFYSMSGSKNYSPDVFSYSILINGYCKKALVDDAVLLFREMQSKGIIPNLTTYNIIIQGLFHGGKWHDALEFFVEMQAVMLKPDFYTYCNMLDGLCRNGQVERALLLLDALESNGDIHIAYYNILVHGLIGSKKLDTALAIFRGIASKGIEYDEVTYNILIKGCCQNGLLEEAKDLLLEMGRANLSPNEITYNAIVQGNLIGGRYDDAEMFFKEMDAKKFSADSFTLRLLLDLFDSEEKNPTLFKMIQKMAPNTLKQK